MYTLKSNSTNKLYFYSVSFRLLKLLLNCIDDKKTRAERFGRESGVRLSVRRERYEREGHKESELNCFKCGAIAGLAGHQGISELLIVLSVS